MKKNQLILPNDKAVHILPFHRGGVFQTENAVDLIKNDLTSGLGNGLFQFNPFGFPENQGFPGSSPLSQVNTIFHDLRWYLVSNFRQVLNQAFVEIGLVQTIVCVPVDDGLRGGVTIKSKQLDEDQINEIQISMDRDDDLTTVGWAQKWNRLFGGAGIIILTDQDPEEELDINQIKSDTPIEFRAVDLWELFWDKQNEGGYDPTTQLDDYEFYSYYGEKLHKSRVMKLKGLECPSFIRPRLRGWGFSIVETLVRSLNQYLKATDLGFQVLDEFKIDVFKIKNLTNGLMAPEAQEKVRRRLQYANRQKNFQNALVMDGEDDWDHKQLSFAGLAEVMQGIRMQVAADMRMPITKLFGTSASAGIGNTDQNDMENYNSMVESQVRNKCKYDILRIIEFKCQKLFGFIPDDISIEFKPLRVLSAIDEQTVKTQKSQIILAWQQSQLITTFEAREAANKAGILDITLDNAGDMLNPDDPEVDDLVTEGVRNPGEITDTDDPGANRADSQKGKATEYGGIPKGDVKVKNSDIFDKASYEADGGDGWIAHDRLKLLETLTHDNPNLWQQCEQEAQRIYGRKNTAFTAWMYVKRGGRLQKMNNDPIYWSPGVTLETIEKMVILKALAFYRNHKATTAAALGIAVRTLDTKLDKYEYEDEKERKKLDDERKRKDEFALRQRGNPPNNIGIAFDPIQALSQAAKVSTDARTNMEPAPLTGAQPGMPVPKRQEVQKVLPSHDAESSKPQKRSNV